MKNYQEYAINILVNGENDGVLMPFKHETELWDLIKYIYPMGFLEYDCDEGENYYWVGEGQDKELLRGEIELYFANYEN